MIRTRQTNQVQGIKLGAASDGTNLDLPERLDSSVAGDLYSQISDLTNRDLRLNGEKVRHIGGLCLQVLIAAKEDWQRANHSFLIHSPSEELRGFLSTIGRTDLIQSEAACP